jgi:hypothetical protein
MVLISSFESDISILKKLQNEKMFLSEICSDSNNIYIIFLLSNGIFFGVHVLSLCGTPSGKHCAYILSHPRRLLS